MAHKLPIRPSIPYELSCKPFNGSTKADPDPQPETRPTEGVNQTVVLQLDNQCFETKISTLVSKSGFFAAMFSAQWQQEHQLKKNVEDPYFVDADPKLFRHILRYLRRGTFPLIYGKGGHDYGMYVALLGEARYFQIDRLVAWLENKTYLNAVKIRKEPLLTQGPDALHETKQADVDVEHHPYLTTQRVYACPRGIPVHQNPMQCGDACRRARMGAPAEYKDEPVMKTMTVRKEVVFNHSVCVDK